MFLAIVRFLHRGQHLQGLALLVAGLHQRLDILRETRAAIATTRVEKLEADARIGADAAPHAFDIRTDFFGKQRQLVHEADVGAPRSAGWGTRVEERLEK